MAPPTNEKHSKGMKRLRSVMNKAMESISMKEQDVAGPFEEMAKKRPTLVKSVQDYHPQILKQIRDAAKEDFDKLCKDKGIDNKLWELEQLGQPTDDVDTRSGDRMDAADAVRSHLFALQKTEDDSLNVLHDELEQQNEQIIDDIRKEEAACTEAIGRLGDMIQKITKRD